MLYIPQITKEGCGIACLKMLLAIVQKDENYLYLDEDEKHGAYSYKDLSLIAERYGVTLIGIKIEDKDDLNHFKEFPMILTIVNPDETSHAILISKRKGNRVKVHNPAKGVYWQKIKKLILRWDGTALAVKQFEKQPYEKIIIDTKDNKSDFISYVLQTLIAVFIALATFFIKPNSSYLWPMIFAVLSLLAEILLRTTLLKRMQRCDKYLRRFLPYVHPDDYYEYFKRSQEYKRSSLTMTLNFIFYLLVVVLIITISLFNSLLLIILIAASLLAAYLDVFFFTPYKKSINKDIENEERALQNEKVLEGVELKVKTMEVKSYRYAYLEIAKKIIVSVLFVFSSVLVSIFEKSFFLTNIIFYTCMSLLLYQSLTPLFSYDYRMEENLGNKARVNNMIHQQMK